VSLRRLRRAHIANSLPEACATASAESLDTTPFPPTGTFHPTLATRTKFPPAPVSRRARERRSCERHGVGAGQEERGGNRHKPQRAAGRGAEERLQRAREGPQVFMSGEDPGSGWGGEGHLKGTSSLQTPRYRRYGAGGRRGGASNVAGS
jgi:hypothetical protein